MSQAALRVVGKEENTEKKRALEAALTQIDRAFGKGSVMKLGSRDLGLATDAVSTGSLGLDIALGIGGLPRGRVIEVYGPESSGKTTLALHVVAEIQKKGGTAAYVDAKFLRITRIHRVFGVDIGRDAALLLDLGDDMQCECGLARGFWTIDLDDAPARQSADAKRNVEAERAGRNRIRRNAQIARAHLHDRALAEGAIDLSQRRLESPLLFCIFFLAHYPQSRL